MEYTEEQLNYYRICYVTTDVLTEGLRTIFKREWDNCYKATKGEWKDEPQNGMDFYNGESPRNQRRNANLLATMIKGDRAEWDCTMLFYAILYSDCIHGLNPVVKSSVDDLRKFRNEEFAHMPKGHLSGPEFQTAITKVDTAFQALGLSILQIQDIRNQRNFPTEELRNVLQKVDDLKKELQEKEEQRQVLEDQLHNEISSFCILPPKPSHEVAGRDREVAEILQKLKQLKSANESRLSYLYVSGNPGSGKSQLASLVAKRLFDEVKEIPCAASFVMTVNAESPDTLLESYVSFARQLKCPEYAVTNTRNSKDLKTDEKITNLKTLIGSKIKLFTSWLLVVDNVSSISRTNVHLPEVGNEQWARGQLLITTQDTQSIPLTNSFTQHISVSKGMESREASSLLTVLSGIRDSEMEDEVAQALDFQPLALASAATYVREVRHNKLTSNFSWKDYVKKLEKGQRGTTEAILTKTNPIYPNSMTAATKFAVEKVISSDKVIHHTFSFLSLCTPQPLSLDIVINYILNVDKEIQDKEIISMRIRRCPLLLFEEEGSGVYIREHQVVHDVINSVVKESQGNNLFEAVNGAVISFNQYMDIQDDHSEHIVPHLTALINTIEKLFSKQDLYQVVESGIIDVLGNPRYFQKLGKLCERYCAFEAAKKFFDLVLELIQRCAECNDENLAEAHCDVASTHRALGNFYQAKKHYEYQLANQMKIVGPEHVYVAGTYCNLGTVYSDLDDMEQAKQYHERALAIFLKSLGPEHLDVARAYNNLGADYLKLGDMEQAKQYHERALAIFLKSLGPEHLDVARAYNNLGVDFQKLGDMEQAKQYHERALVIRLKSLGPEHVDIAPTYGNLGVVYKKLGDMERAKQYHERALAIFLKSFGHEHLDVAHAYNNLGADYQKLGEMEQAKQYHERALAICLNSLGPEHLYVAHAYNNLGADYQDLGDMEQAKQYHERALAIFLKSLGPEHLYVAHAYNKLAADYLDLGDMEQAEQYYERALTIFLKSLGPEHLDVARAYNKLAADYHDLGDMEQAKQYYERALTIFLKSLGPEHLDVARA